MICLCDLCTGPYYSIVKTNNRTYFVFCSAELTFTVICTSVRRRPHVSAVTGPLNEENRVVTLPKNKLNFNMNAK